MRRRSRHGNAKLFLLTVVAPRVAGLLIPLVIYLQSNAFHLDSGAIQIRLASGVVGLLLLRTTTGRRLLFVGWVFILAVIVLNLKFIEFSWDTVELLILWIAFGALWFVDWSGLVMTERPRRGQPNGSGLR